MIHDTCKIIHTLLNFPTKIKPQERERLKIIWKLTFHLFRSKRRGWGVLTFEITPLLTIILKGLLYRVSTLKVPHRKLNRKNGIPPPIIDRNIFSAEFLTTHVKFHSESKGLQMKKRVLGSNHSFGLESTFSYWSSTTPFSFNQRVFLCIYFFFLFFIITKYWLVLLLPWSG